MQQGSQTIKANKKRTVLNLIKEAKASHSNQKTRKFTNIQYLKVTRYIVIFE
ncbi:hypothetical protein GCM10022291_30660 [Postechiella marina]|uniref:Uncharacterized protein n=1 Tax=Postechiella marina TaxID=943941 RepID=A0ABP8CFV8_9FLAO